MRSAVRSWPVDPLSSRHIPIENIYYLLCYAWDALDEAEIVSVDVTPEMKLQDLLAGVLRGGVAHLLKRGLDRAYVTSEDEIAGVRGRLDIGASVKRASFRKARACCVFDELSPDVPHNRIVKTMLRRIANVEGLSSSLANDLRELYRRMPGIHETAITTQMFRRVTLGRNNAFYRFLLDVCEIAHRNLLVDEATGAEQFRDFTRDDSQMARLFEKFLFQFFAREQRQYKVHAPRFDWRATGEPEDIAMLPEMRTDIVLRDGLDTVVIDAKYYSETLSEHMNKATVRSAHLYQLFSYMSHLAPVSKGGRVRGMLVYPRTTETVRVRAELFNYPFLATTINLAQPWSNIREDLLRILL